MRRQTNNVIPFKTKKALSSFLLHCHPQTHEGSLSKWTIIKGLHHAALLWRRVFLNSPSGKMLDNHSAGWSSSGRRVRNRDRWSHQVARNPRLPSRGNLRSVERATGSRLHREPFGHARSWLYNPASVSASILYMTNFWRWPIRLSQCCVLTFDDVEHCLLWENTFLHLN